LIEYSIVLSRSQEVEEKSGEIGEHQNHDFFGIVQFGTG
jgi:hypothetical protein